MPAQRLLSFGAYGRGLFRRQLPATSYLLSFGEARRGLFLKLISPGILSITPQRLITFEADNGKTMEQKNHVWNFSIINGIKRVNLVSGDDLINLASLDKKLWTALSCPVNDLEIDRKTLALVDEDKDGQIRVREVIDAVNWAISVLKDPADLLKRDAVFPLAAINASTEQGRILLDSAQVILKNLGKEGATSLTVEETADTEKIFAGTKFNGDDIITEDSTADPALQALMSDIILSVGAATDRGGKPGVSRELLLAFFEQSEKYAAWQARKTEAQDSILPLGNDTEEAYNTFSIIRAKVDDFFIRCRLAAFDPQSTEVLNLQVARVQNITEKDLSNCIAEIAEYPIARIEAGRSLPVSSGINPAWEHALVTFKKLAVDKLLPGKDSITEQEWNTVSKTFDPFAKWISEKEGTSVEALGFDRVKQILSGTYKEQLLSLIDQDKALETEANNIMLVDKLVRYHRDLFTLLQNFVTFHDFYTPGYKAIFQVGTLYIDQRSCDLCIKVQDMPKHGKLDSFSGIYLLYCDCVSKSTNETMSIVAAVTNGDIDNLMVGRNALFYDRHGQDWDATITKITENPISIRQAFFSPYRKLVRAIETQINKVAAAADDKSNAGLTKGVGEIPVVNAEPEAKKEPSKPFDIGKFVGIFAAIGLAFGAIGSVLASFIGGFVKLTWWKMPLAIAGILLIISGPAMIMAYLKLRKRNLAPILDSNGWAINAQVIINIRFGATLTQLAALPRGAKISLQDPFTKKKSPVLPALLIIIIVAVAAFYLMRKYGYIHFHF